MSQSSQENMRQIECDALRAQTNITLVQISPEFNASGPEKQHSMVVEQVLQYIKKITHKLEPFTEGKYQDLRDLGWTDEDISIIKKEIDKRQ